jgi:hypothetical protein
MMTKNRAIASAVAMAVPVAVALLGLQGCSTTNPMTTLPAQSTPSAPSAKPADAKSADAKSVTTAHPAQADKARLTGYASASVSGGPSGPITVALHGASVARLDQLVSRLQKWTGATCVENITLYQLDFTPVAGAKRGFTVAGQECANLVYITAGGKTVTKVDGACALLTAVRRLLPATAKATRQLTPPNCVKKAAVK